MQLDKQTMVELADIVANAVIKVLEEKNLVCVENRKQESKRTAYQKTEQLLYNYRGFKKVVDERMREIEDLRAYGVPKRSGSIVEYSPGNGLVQGLVLEEETVENAVANVQRSVEGTVRVISMIDKCMAELAGDPYYKILELRYFEGRTQDDIANLLGCTQQTISKNKSRLVKELALRIFPSQSVEEMMQ